MLFEYSLSVEALGQVLGGSSRGRLRGDGDQAEAAKEPSKLAWIWGLFEGRELFLSRASKDGFMEVPG